VRYPNDPDLDVAYLPLALGRKSRAFLPLLPPGELLVGADVYTFGHFPTDEPTVPEPAYFRGAVVGFSARSNRYPTLTLPFAIVEGMSGSPVLTNHNGPKVVGMAIGNRISRVLAAEIVDYHNGSTHVRESINRIVEFGVAYHGATLCSLLDELRVEGAVVTNQSVDRPELR
jgi:hypothetical protein